MDPSRFDRLVVALMHPASRRATLAVVLGGSLAGLATVAAAGGCPPGKKRCHGRCIKRRRPCPPPAGRCHAEGNACRQADDCCSHQCVAGVCVNATGCQDDGGACTQDDACCSQNCLHEPRRSRRP